MIEPPLTTYNAHEPRERAQNAAQMLIAKLATREDVDDAADLVRDLITALADERRVNGLSVTTHEEVLDIARRAEALIQEAA